jgi:hypothetical protein
LVEPEILSPVLISKFPIPNIETRKLYMMGKLIDITYENNIFTISVMGSYIRHTILIIPIHFVEV